MSACIEARPRTVVRRRSAMRMRRPRIHTGDHIMTNTASTRSAGSLPDTAATVIAGVGQLVVGSHWPPSGSSACRYGALPCSPVRGWGRAPLWCSSPGGARC